MFPSLPQHYAVCRSEAALLVTTLRTKSYMHRTVLTNLSILTIAHKVTSFAHKQKHVIDFRRRTSRLFAYKPGQIDEWAGHSFLQPTMLMSISSELGISRLQVLGDHRLGSQKKRKRRKKKKTWLARMG